jgi:hypothetical protein
LQKTGQATPVATPPARPAPETIATSSPSGRLPDKYFRRAAAHQPVARFDNPAAIILELTQPLGARWDAYQIKRSRDASRESHRAASFG